MAADEPTSGLDTHAQTMFAGVMRTHLAAGGMIVAVTHIALGLEQAGSDAVQHLRLEDYQLGDHSAETQGWLL